MVRSLVKVAGTLAAAGLMLAACGDGSEDSEAASGPTTAATSPTESDTVDPDLDGKCREALTASLEILNPSWRENVLDAEELGTSTQALGASAWLVAFAQAHATAQEQGCVGDLDYFADIQQRVDNYMASVETGFPNVDAITQALEAASSLHGVEGP